MKVPESWSNSAQSIETILLWYDLTLGNNKMLHITTCVDLKPIE